MPKSIYSIINDFEEDFDNNSVTIVDGYEFSQLDTIKKINRYYAGKFDTGNIDEFGRKFFYNFTKPRVKNAQKNIDIDTKNIELMAMKPEDYSKVWLLRRELEIYMRDTKLGKKLNEITATLPKYGTVAVKRVGGDEIFEMVDLRNFKNDMTASSLKNSWRLEEHYYTPSELREKKGWDKENIENAIENFSTYRKENYVTSKDKYEPQMGNAKFIRVVELTAEMEETFLTDDYDDTDIVPQMWVVVMPEGTGQQKTAGDGLKLFSEKLTTKEYRTKLYKEVHYDKEVGRWLGYGIVEDMFEMQELKNTQVNYEIKAMELANLILLATNDKSFAKNVLTDLMSGDVIQVEGAINRIPTEVRSMNVNSAVAQQVDSLANELANSFEATTGETMPAGTPFRLGLMLNRNANKLFDFIRQNYGLFLEELVQDWILPELMKKTSQEHILQITDKAEYEYLAREVGKKQAWDAVKNIVMDTGKFPTAEEAQQIEDMLVQRAVSTNGMAINISKDFYKDVELKVVVTDESLDKAERITTLTTILQLLGASPQLVNSPVLQELLNLSGLSEIDIQKQQAQVVQQLQPQQAPSGPQGAIGAPTGPPDANIATE
jgi:hypothetical protein